MEAEEGVQTKLRPKYESYIDTLCKTVVCTGCLTYELFSTHIMIPKQFSSFFSTKDLAAADFLWFHAHVGIGLHLYRQPILQKATIPWRVTYSVFGATMFNFGSALLWGSFKMVTPKTADPVKVTVGLASGGVLLYIGWKFLNFLDTLLIRDQTSPEVSEFPQDIVDKGPD